MDAPLIGITTSLSEREPPRASLNAAYIAAVQASGGVPVPLPPFLSARSRRELLAHLGGLLLTGGGDVDPALYGEAPVPESGGVSQRRDQFEAELSAEAFQRQLPVLAICRGMQILNVARGGTLIQDVPSQVEGALAHAQEGSRAAPTHAVRLAAGSRLAGVCGAAELEVNSLHHQAVKKLAPGFVPVAWSADGLVEALELPGYAPFFLAVQWHPEEMAGAPHSRALFAALIQAATPPSRTT